MYYTYMLRCEDESIYTGIAKEPGRRMKEHFEKGSRCAKYTKSHTAKRLEALWACENRSLASELEFHIKLLSKAQKEKLISDNDFMPLSDRLDERDYKRINIKEMSCLDGYI